MKRVLFAAFLSVSFLAITVCGQQSAEGQLTNESVVKLVKAGFKEKTVIAIIHNRRSAFKLDPEQLIQLKRQGVNENIILAMLAAQDSTFVLGEDEWISDEAFFKEKNGRSNTGDGSQSSSTNIFGSGGSSQSRSESGRGNGDKANEGSVTGSATVRIIKPGEGAAATTPKLEKTPVLTNEGVIRLVEAGFSEGTIIKRIEDSPVDFDLSPGKLDELYKKRVTDQIVAAMAAAMGNTDRTGSRP